ncbi:MAG: TetR/AcrR family transcriptional regulator [Synergistaceae bacterium]|nr:TetR/AcrR family transcriptional regulator [Synergistaceae bacterium]
MNNDLEKLSTRQKILDSATDLFAMKGYTETTVRELAAVVGVKEASIYNHFPSKNNILECILEEYLKFTTSFFDRGNLSALRENPTADNILSCMRFSFPKGQVDFYLKRLYVILQEQHRNPTVRAFMCERYILNTEQTFEMIVNKLKEFNVLRQDTDPDFWVKTHSSLIYAFTSRLLLGIGDSSPEFSGMGMIELLRNLYGTMLKTCGVEK